MHVPRSTGAEKWFSHGFQPLLLLCCAVCPAADLLALLQVAHGNEDTFREMLRIKRSVAASFSQTHFNTTIIDAATAPVTTGMVANPIPSPKPKPLA